MPENDPNKILADRIFEKLKKAELITEDGKDQFIKHLSEGTLNGSSWKVALEEPIKSKQNPSEDETPET